MPEAVSIFVLPPNPKVLRTRLRNRFRAEGQVNEAELYRRLARPAKKLRIIASTAIFSSTTYSTGQWHSWKQLSWLSDTIATANP